MSTPETGDAKVVADVVADAKALVASAYQAEQLDMLDAPTPEEMIEAREALGPEAGRMAVVREARSRKQGRPKGSKNKRTDDFARYLLGFGQHPAITMMQIQSTPPEVLMEASRREIVKVVKDEKILRYTSEPMTYQEAQHLRVRCAEGLLPYLESKKPVAVDMTFNGIADLVIEGVTHSREEIGEIFEADFLELDDNAAGGKQ